jgi:hypothetical protein
LPGLTYSVLAGSRFFRLDGACFGGNWFYRQENGFTGNLRVIFRENGFTGRKVALLPRARPKCRLAHPAGSARLFAAELSRF